MTSSVPRSSPRWSGPSGLPEALSALSRAASSARQFVERDDVASARRAGRRARPSSEHEVGERVRPGCAASSRHDPRRLSSLAGPVQREHRARSVRGASSRSGGAWIARCACSSTLRDRWSRPPIRTAQQPVRLRACREREPGRLPAPVSQRRCARRARRPARARRRQPAGALVPARSAAQPALAAACIATAARCWRRRSSRQVRHWSR